MQPKLFETKVCSKCGQTKHVSDFHEWSRVCKVCRKAQVSSYYLDNKEKIREYRQNNKERARKYYQDNKKKIKKRGRKYYWSPEKKRKKWRHSEAGKLSRAKMRAKRRDLGHNPLNESFPGSVWHHVNNDEVVAIPEEIHRKLANRRSKHRVLVLEHYGSLENMINGAEVI